jgi:hypothetical protein
MLRKAGILLAVFVSLNAALFAEEDGKSIGRFFAGGGTSFGPASSGGGHGEFSFLIYHNRVDVRNHFVLRAEGLEDGTDSYGVLILSEKLSWGGVAPDGRFRVYGFGEAGLGFYAGGPPDREESFGSALVYSFGGGGGTDIFYSSNGSIYFETGYLGRLLGSTYIQGPIFQIGWRGYF